MRAALLSAHSWGIVSAPQTAPCVRFPPAAPTRQFGSHSVLRSQGMPDASDSARKPVADQPLPCGVADGRNGRDRARGRRRRAGRRPAARADRRAGRGPAHHSLGALGRRRRIHPPRQSRSERRHPDRRRRTRVRRRCVPRQTRLVGRSPVGQPLVCLANGQLLRRDAHGAAARQECSQRRVAGIPAHFIRAEQTLRSACAGDPLGRRRERGPAAGGPVLSRPRVRAQRANSGCGPRVPGPRHAMRPMPQSSPDRRLPAGRLLRHLLVLRARESVHRQGQEGRVRRIGRRRNQLQIGLHRRRARARSAMPARRRALGRAAVRAGPAVRRAAGQGRPPRPQVQPPRRTGQTCDQRTQRGIQSQYRQSVVGPAHGARAGRAGRFSARR